MASERVKAAVREVLSTVLQRRIDDGELVVRVKEERWDSLAHMEILFAIEDSLGIQFDEEEMAHLNSEAALTMSAERHGAA